MSDLTYFIITIGLLFFFVGYMVSCLMKNIRIKTHIETHHGRTDEGDFINYKLLKILGITVLVFFAEEALETLLLVRTGFSLFEIRTSLQGYAEYEFSNNLYVIRSQVGVLYTLFILPVYNALLIIACIDFFAGKRDKGLISIALGCLLLKSFKEGSRVALFAFIIYLVFSMVIYGKEINISKKVRKRIIVAIAGLFVAIVVISNIRISQGEKNLFEEIYLYITCCVPLLDAMMLRLQSGVLEYTYGAMSLYGVLQFTAILLTFLSGHSLEWYMAGAQAIIDTETFIEVRSASYSSRANAYTTMFYYFYRDAGMIGVLLGSTSFGMLCTVVYKNLKGKLKAGAESKRVVFIYLLLLQGMILSFIRIYFSVASYFFTFVYAFLFISKRYKNGNKYLGN